MTENKKIHKKLTPYIPFKTFQSFIDSLKKSKVIPPIVDTSLLQTMSGSMKTQILSTLKFLNLIDENNHVLESIKNLVGAYDTDAWPETLRPVIKKAYDHVMHDVNWETGTSQQLSQTFKERANVDGQMLDKSVRFFLSALDSCSYQYSPYFKKRKKPRKPTQRKKKKDQTPITKDEHDYGELGHSDDFEGYEGAKFRIPVPGKKNVVIYLPEDIDQQDWEMVKIMLNAYVKRLTGEEGGEL